MGGSPRWSHRGDLRAIYLDKAAPPRFLSTVLTKELAPRVLKSFSHYRETFCLFEPAFNVPYRLVHVVEVPATTLVEVLDWTWRYTNIVERGDPWSQIGLRSAMVGDVFLVNGEAHAAMMMGFERFGFQREGDVLILHGQQGFPPIRPSPFHARP